MELSIVILTYNSEHVIEDCLTTVYAACENLSFEIIIVDNHSTDSTLSLIKTHHPHASLLQNNRNKGVAAARNQGIKMATGQFVMLLDDDVVVPPSAIVHLLSYIKSHPQCGIVGPQLLNPDHTYQTNALPIPSVAVKTKRIASKCMGLIPQNPYLNDIKTGTIFTPGYLIGASQLIRKELFNTVGLLDERIFYGPEDADFCLRVSKAGYSIQCLPNVNIIHRYQRRSYNFSNLSLLFAHLKGLGYFWMKWLWKI